MSEPTLRLNDDYETWYEAVEAYLLARGMYFDADEYNADYFMDAYLDGLHPQDIHREMLGDLA